ncbi:DsrE family protein [Propionispira raffinosivorans]|uniref:DsrE family protein n=1 Tax=Propionispira raffinosivorans TaxID=86959 RepID=UPI000362CE12|nr:DsrE family protein [Propionispira raffinosivorans]
MDLFKVVFHIDEMHKWALTLGNAKNFIKDIGTAEYYIEIVANAEAVKIFDGTNNEGSHELLQEMEWLMQQGIKIMVCRNAMQANAVQETDLPKYVTVVSAGITRLVTLQGQGYCYIKP